MSRPNPSRQQGFGLLTFVIVTCMITLLLVVGYSGLLTQQAANALVGNQTKYLQQTFVGLEAVWEQHAGDFDRNVAGNAVDPADVLALMGASPRYGMELVVSRVLAYPAEGLAYRNAVMYLPTESDATNPPDLATFINTGEFNTCSNPDSQCDSRVFRVFSSLEIQREKAAETELRLRKIAAKAQSYFKARMLQDPEKSIDTNYFRRPSGNCHVSGSLDLGCIDSYQTLISQPWVTEALGLTNEELYTAWGDPIEVSNLQDSETTATPFSMAFRAPKPYGDSVTIKAVQHL